MREFKLGDFVMAYFRGPIHHGIQRALIKSIDKNQVCVEFMRFNRIFENTISVKDIVLYDPNKEDVYDTRDEYYKYVQSMIDNQQ